MIVGSKLVRKDCSYSSHKMACVHCKNLNHNDSTSVVVLDTTKGDSLEKLKNLDLKKILLIQEPSENLSVKFSLLKTPAEGDFWHKYDLTLTFDNNLHEFSKDYAYEITLRAHESDGIYHNLFSHVINRVSLMTFFIDRKFYYPEKLLDDVGTSSVFPHSSSSAPSLFGGSQTTPTTLGAATSSAAAAAPTSSLFRSPVSTSTTARSSNAAAAFGFATPTTTTVNSIFGFGSPSTGTTPSSATNRTTNNAAGGLVFANASPAVTASASSSVRTTAAAAPSIFSPVTANNPIPNFASIQAAVNARRDLANSLSASPTSTSTLPLQQSSPSLLPRKRDHYMCLNIRRFKKESVKSHESPDASTSSDAVSKAKLIANDKAPVIDIGTMLQETGLYSDVSLVVGDEIFSAHKDILARESEVFRAMFSHDLSENANGIVKIDDFDAQVIKSLLTYIYTGRTTRLSDIPLELFAAAHKYDIGDLKMKCEEYLMFNANEKNIVDIIDLAETYDLTALKQSSLDFVKTHEPKMVQEDSYRRYLCRNLTIDNVTSTVKLCVTYQMEDVKQATFEFVKNHLEELADVSEFLELFALRPFYMRDLYVYLYKKNNDKDVQDDAKVSENQTE